MMGAVEVSFERPEEPPPVVLQGEDEGGPLLRQPEDEPPPILAMLNGQAGDALLQLGRQDLPVQALGPGQGPDDEDVDVTRAGADCEHSQDTETCRQCAENHYGWKEWCENAMEDTAITHLAICDAEDGCVWTRTSARDAAGYAGAHETWDDSFPLFHYSGDALNILYKMTAETYWASDVDERRLCEAEARLAFAASYHERLAEHSTLSRLSWDLLDRVQDYLATEVRFPRQGSSFNFQGENWLPLRFEARNENAGHYTPTMLIARRGQRGLTAFRTTRALLVAVADQQAREDHIHTGATHDAGQMADFLLQNSL